MHENPAYDTNSREPAYLSKPGSALARPGGQLHILRPCNLTDVCP